MNMSEGISETVIEAPQKSFLDRAGLRGFPWKTASILYTISWGWLFIVRDSYWSDDWDEFRFRDLTGYDYGQFGFAPWKDLNVLMFDIFGPAFLRVAVFVFFFFSCLFVYKILCTISLINSGQRVVISLLFLILPFNTPRVALYTFYFSLSYCLFFAAWCVLVTRGTRRSRYLACALFFLSFQMFTMLVFFLLPVVHLFSLEGRGKLHDVISWLRRNLFFLSLPLIFWIMRSLFWSSSRRYHEITDNKIKGFFGFIYIFLVIAVGLVAVYRQSGPNRRKVVLLVFFGFGSMLVGYLPYVIYGLVGYGFDVPITYLVTMLGRSDWFSRHQILQPLGFSILLVGLIGLLPSFANRFRHWFVGAILAISVVFNVAFGFEYFVDYSKQNSVVAALDAKPTKTVGGEIQMVDQTTFLNARQRSYRERDWLGLVGLAEGVDSAKKLKVVSGCSVNPNTRLVLIQGPETHWQALKNWVGDGDMGFKVTIDDTPGACKPELMQIERVSGAIPILFYFTGAKN
jgi:hypothetical protein